MSLHNSMRVAYLEEEVELLPALVAHVVLRVQVLSQVVHAQREVLGGQVLQRKRKEKVGEQWRRRQRPKATGQREVPVQNCRWLLAPALLF